LLVAVQVTHAQKKIADEPAKVLVTMPFQLLNGGVVIVQGLLPAYPDTLNFVLDTGSGGISLDSSLVAHLGLSPVPTSIKLRGVAGIKKVSFLRNQRLNLGGLIIDRLNFHINDYSFLSSIYGIRIDGIIGYSLFSRFIVKIDYDDLKLQICSNGRLEYPSGGYLLKPHIRSLVVQDASIQDNRKIQARFLHDIGAGVSLMLSKAFVDDSAFLMENRKLWPKRGHGLGGKIDMQLTIVKAVRFGPYRFKNVPTLIFEDQYDVTSYPYLCGLIGNDIFRRFNAIYNYAQGEIHLLPNKGFRDRFDYSYSGLDIQLINGTIEVGGVAEKSPAAIAGIKEGDIILGINNDFSANFARYKKMLQQANKQIFLFIRRGEELLITQIKIKNIKRKG